VNFERSEILGDHIIRGESYSSGSNHTLGTQTTNHPSMLSLAEQEIDAIAPVLSEFHPNADTTQIGSWGLLYYLSGAEKKKFLAPPNCSRLIYVVSRGHPGGKAGT
jgi:hypothetical protein